MWRQFFCVSSNQSIFAWFGVFVLLVHAFLHGYVKFAINRWYRTFYNILESAGSLAAVNTTTTDEWVHMQSAVFDELVEFCKILIIPILSMPVAKYIRARWALQWRLSLAYSYLRVWNPNIDAIEGSSQRVHEDSYRFSRGVELVLTTVLDSLVTIVVFIPVLLSLGSDTTCPTSVHFLAFLGDSWLVAMAISSAVLGFVVTLILGHRLVQLEVQNQIVEAHMRQDLVILETNAGAICCSSNSASNAPDLQSPFLHFVPIFERVEQNYKRLFLNFGILNFWLTLFDQLNVLLPYLIFAPLLFSPSAGERITLGILMQVSNSFDKVFGSLSVVADNWSGGARFNTPPPPPTHSLTHSHTHIHTLLNAVNEFRSVIFRLRQFEASIYDKNTAVCNGGVLARIWLFLLGIWSGRGSRTSTTTTTNPLFGNPVEMVSVEQLDESTTGGARA